MNEIASETYCAANHPDYYWPPAESVEAYKNLNFNFVIFQYDNGRFMAAIECRVFDKQGGIYRGTSNEENQNDYFHDLETDCEKDVYLQIILAPFIMKCLNYPSSEICASSIDKILLRWAYNQDWLEC